LNNSFQIFVNDTDFLKIIIHSKHFINLFMEWHTKLRNLLTYKNNCIISHNVGISYHKNILIKSNRYCKTTVGKNVDTFYILARMSNSYTRYIIIIDTEQADVNCLSNIVRCTYFSNPRDVYRWQRLRVGSQIIVVITI